MIKSYRDLRIWQTSIGLVKEVYDLTGNFPKEEIFCLVAQMRRAAISIPSNIAEGFRRNYRKEYKQFLHIVLGSCAELETQVTIAKELSYIDEKKEKKIIEETNYLSSMIFSLIKKL